MARFAKDLLRRMNDLTKRLEVHLGPDTGDLSLRVGLHSGSLTGGVIRGGKSWIANDDTTKIARCSSNNCFFGWHVFIVHFQTKLDSSYLGVL